jgi:protein-S-isoprenylcysteine O-methyltransferase Ste14
MNKKEFKFIFAPIGVAFGITMFVSVSILISKALNIQTITEFISFIPAFIFRVLGVVFLSIFLPIFISGIYYLERRGAVGQSDTLRTYGIYKYTRNPMYVGISMTIIAVGLILLNTGVIIAGVIWFCITFIQCKREEVDLLNRFGKEYKDYKRRTPMFLPNISLIIKDIIKKGEKNEI